MNETQKTIQEYEKRYADKPRPTAADLDAATVDLMWDTCQECNLLRLEIVTRLGWVSFYSRARCEKRNPNAIAYFGDNEVDRVVDLYAGLHILKVEDSAYE